MINSVVLMGRLVSNPELKTVGDGVSVVNCRIAVDKRYVKQGEERKADFFDLVAWRQTAEFIAKFFQKGNLIAVEGALSTRTYQTKDGQNRTVTEIEVDRASFTGERPAQRSNQIDTGSEDAVEIEDTSEDGNNGESDDLPW